MTINFDDFFEQKEHSWMSSMPASEALNMLRGFYPEFFYDTDKDKNLINYSLLKEALCEAGQLNHKARELCKNLFRISWQQKSGKDVMSTPEFLQLKDQFGSHITAHGVEEAKGGLLNIVMMFISDTVKAQNMYWGSLVDGPPDMSPIPHGPYFMIYDIALRSNKPAPHNPKCSNIKYILVPCEEVADTLRASLDKAETHGLINAQDLMKFKQKIVTYDKLTQICKKLHSPIEEKRGGIGFFEAQHPGQPVQEKPLCFNGQLSKFGLGKYKL